MRNPFRTFLAALGVGWGIFMLIIMIAAGKGLENGITADFGQRVTNSFVMWSMRTTMPYQGFKKGRWIRMDNDDMAYLKANSANIDLLCPRNQLNGWRGGNNVHFGKNTTACNVYGDYPEYIDIEPLDIYEGRFLNKGDIADERKVCVLGKKVSKLLYDPGIDPIGTYVRISGVNFRVVGLFASKRSGEDAEEETNSIYVPFTTFQKAFNFGDQVSWVTMTSKLGYPVSELEKEVKEIMKTRKKVHPDDQRAFGGWNMEEEFNEVSTIFEGIHWLGVIIGTLSLLAGVIGIGNIMLITVKERTKEFGIRRALGATPMSVVIQVVTETLLITVVAGLVGMILGVLAIDGVNMLLDTMGDTGSFRNPRIESSVVFSALMILVLSGVIVGMLPASRAVAVKPVDAIRDE